VPPLTDTGALLLDEAHPGRVFAGVTVVGVAISDDLGATWMASGTGLAGVAVSAIAADGPALGPVYLASEGAGVYRTDDRGGSWTWLGEGAGSLLSTSLAVDPNDGDNLFVGNRLDGVWRTTDGGSTWSPVSAGLTNQRVQTLAMDPADSARLFAGTRGGVFVTADSGVMWASASNGLTDLDVTVVAVDPDDPQLIFASTKDGLFRSVDGGAGWEPSGAGLGGVDVTDLLAADNRWWAASDTGVFVSDNDGSNWTVPGTPLTLPILALSWDPRPDRWIAAATEGGGIMILADDGTWAVDDPALAAETVESIAFAGESTGYAGGAGGTWVRTELPLFADSFEKGGVTGWSAASP